MSNISYAEFNRSHKIFQSLHKEDLEFTISFSNQYLGGNLGYKYTFTPQITNLNNVEKLAKVFDASKIPVKVQYFQQSDQKFVAEVQSINNSELVTPSHDKKPNSPVKFYSDVLSAIPGYAAYVLTKAPTEKQQGNNTYRIVAAEHKDPSGYAYYNNPTIVACVNQESPLYNYLDQNHVLVYSDCSKEGKSAIMVTDQFTLDVNYLSIIFSLHPSALDGLLQKDSFLPARDARIILLKAEKALPPRFQDAYKELKLKVLEDFEKNAQNVMVSKLIRKEVENVTLNEIRIGQKTATYETVSIEADDLASTVFQKLDSNSQFNIFEFINVYTNWVESTLATQPVDATGLKFAEAKAISFKINNIPINVSITNKNTRRYINGKPINKNELSKVLGRASCFTTEAEFNAFVKQVSRMSLALTDVLNKGMNVKTYLFSDDHYKNTPATSKHPRIRFKKVGTKLQLILDKDTTMPVKRVVELMNKVNYMNKRAGSHCYVNHYGGRATDTPQDSWMETQLLAVLPEFVDGITQEQMKQLFKDIRKERDEAEGKAEESLNQVVKMVGAEKTKMNGKDGYKIKGIKREYFVELESLQVWDVAANRYICIVPGKHDQGVGADSVISRLLALKNDERVAKQVGTLNY